MVTARRTLGRQPETRGASVKAKSYCKGLEIDRALVRGAYDLWLTKSSGRKNGWRVAKEYGSADALVDEIVWEITMRTLAFEPIRRYERIEPTNGKRRTIGVESVKQQVCDYVAVLALEPLLEAKAGFYQTASVQGKGQRLCRGALRRWSREGGYHVKADVRKCYPSISHDVVMRILHKYVRSADVLYLCETLLETYDHGGLEIGSFFSLKMAQLVLSFAYHLIEGLHKERRGRRVPLVRHQMWHMDDLILLGPDKRNLKAAMRALARYLREEFGLELKPWKIAKTSETEPLDMGGFVVRERRTTLRPSLFIRARRAFRRFRRRPSVSLARRCCSYWGWLLHSDSDGFIQGNGIHRLLRRACGIIATHDRRTITCGTLATAPA